MEKVIFLLAVLISAFNVQAQDALAAFRGSAVTLTNATSSADSLELKGAKKTVTFQANITKTSGTVAGTFKVFGSLSRTGAYDEVHSESLTDGTATYTYTAAHNGYRYWFVLVTTTGTQVSTTRSYYLYRD